MSETSWSEEKKKSWVVFLDSSGESLGLLPPFIGPDLFWLFSEWPRKLKGVLW